jgi:hypothetical protein
MTVQKIMVTNNTSGNHDPVQWALTSAEMIADSSQLSGERLLAAQKLQLAIAEVLTKHHETVQCQERVSLMDPLHFLVPLRDALTVEVDKLIEEIKEVAVGTDWEAHFKVPSVIEAMIKVVEGHFMSSMHVERLVHADKNPSEQAKLYVNGVS